MSKLLVGAAVLGIVGVGLAASSSAKENERGGKKTAPNGQSLDELAKQSTDDMLRQDIAAIRADVGRWKSASDPETAGALSFTIEQAAAGVALPESQLDGANGSPVLRAFGLRVLQLEGRKARVEMWAKAWTSTLPALSEALRSKAKGLSAKTDADPIPDEATLRQISEAVLSGDPDRMRQVAARLDGLGFPEQAADLRAMADLIEKGAKADPEKPAPPPPADLDDDEPDDDDETPPAPRPTPKPVEPKPAPTPKPVEPKPAPIPTDRVVVVRKGEGMFQVAQRLLGKSAGASRWKEMRAINVPPFKTDKKGNVIVNAGELFNVPKSWPAHPDAIPGVSPGPKKTTPKPSPASPSPAPKLPSASTRLVVVKKGEGVFQVAQRLLGKSAGASRWKELRALNVPPFKQDKAGNVLLQPGDKLKVPTDWPRNAAEEILGADGRGGMNPRQLKASRVALGAHFKQVDPAALMEFQKREGIEATGSYGPATALCLHQRFGMVPPVPHTWGSNEARARAKFARAMYRAGKRDPQRADEFRLQAKRAEGKAA
jgi:hypothetical protein